MYLVDIMVNDNKQQGYLHFSTNVIFDKTYKIPRYIL